MINIDVLDEEIHDLEARGDTTYAQCERLAWLYIVRDHVKPNTTQDTTPTLRGSEFLELASGVSYPALMSVLNEHIETVRVLYPKSYDALIDRIKAIKYQM